MTNKIIPAMQILGYKAHDKGVCFGIENMAIQAAVRKQFPEFKKRMDFIHSYEDEELFLTDLTRAESIRFKKHEIKQSLLKWGWNSFTAEEKKLNDEQVAMLCSTRPFLKELNCTCRANYTQNFLPLMRSPKDKMLWPQVKS